ncbi:hypothetical protein CHS0354_035114 [Potamilus streckersoni]|uniref:Uncharacterized protein n=1 Tax=Potamilus streckersoni TaxID=2493646 RepID=A0AAE0TJ08_9BIVA|nr:hypothetical protein CHS0354_035114 [Potamilus streckersoni]
MHNRKRLVLCNGISSHGNKYKLSTPSYTFHINQPGSVSGRSGSDTSAFRRTGQHAGPQQQLQPRHWSRPLRAESSVVDGTSYSDSKNRPEILNNHFSSAFTNTKCENLPL